MNNFVAIRDAHSRIDHDHEHEGVPCRLWTSTKTRFGGGDTKYTSRQVVWCAAGLSLRPGLRLDTLLCGHSGCHEERHFAAYYYPEVVAEREGRLTAGEPWFMSAPEWVASLRDVPQTRYYLDNTVEPGGLTIICGHPKTGKSLMALDMMLTMATGSPCGPWHPTEGPLNVGYVDLDGPEAGTLHRLEAFSAHRGIAIPSTLKMYRSRRLQLLEKGVAETLLEEVKQHELHVLTIDTLFRSYGGDENSSKDLKRYIDVLDQLMSEAGVAIMLVHHLRKPAAEGFRSPDFDPQEGLRGSSALASVYDHIISLQRGRVKALGKELTTVAIQQGKQVPQSWFQVEISEDADHLIYSARHDEPSEWSVPSRRFGGGE